MKSFFCVPLVVLVSLLSGCMSDGYDTIVLPPFLSSSSEISSSSSEVFSSSSEVSSSSSLVSFICDINPTISYGSVTYEGQEYRTVDIGGQVWFAENLNYEVGNSICYGDDPANCEIYGRLYDWETAMNACPDDWHLPSQAEWNALSSYAQSTSGCSSCDRGRLKATCGWYNNGNGTDDYGFSALPGGYYYTLGSFSHVGITGNWWSASEDEYNSVYAYSRYMEYDYNSDGEYADWLHGGKSDLRSVRCLQD